jgi:hypothetical protein
MTWRQLAVFAAFAVIAAITTATAQQSFAMTQQSVLMVGDDDIMIRGCVQPADPRAYTSVDMLVWGQGNVMLTGITGLNPVTPLGNTTPYAVGASGFANRVFYWMEDDDDLLQYLGQMVEVRGDLKDFQRSEVEVDREGGYTKIELDLHDRKETIRLPTSWLIGTGIDREQDIHIVARRIDVDDVLVLGACRLR